MDAVRAFKGSKVPAVRAEYEAVVDALKKLGYTEGSQEFDEEIVAHIVEREAQRANRTPVTRNIVERVKDAVRSFLLKRGWRLPKNPNDLMLMAEGAAWATHRAADPTADRAAREVGEFRSSQPLPPRKVEVKTDPLAKPLTLGGLGTAQKAKDSWRDNADRELQADLRDANTIGKALPIIVDYALNADVAMNREQAAVVIAARKRAEQLPNAPFLNAMAESPFFGAVRNLILSVAAADPTTLAEVGELRTKAVEALRRRAANLNPLDAEPMMRVRAYLSGKMPGLDSDEQFLANGLADPVLREILRSVRVTPTENVVTALIGKVRALLGIKPTENNVVTELVRILTGEGTAGATPPPGGRASKNLNLNPNPLGIDPNASPADNSRTILNKISGAFDNVHRFSRARALGTMRMSEIDETWGNNPLLQVTLADGTKVSIVSMLRKALDNVNASAARHIEANADLLQRWELWRKSASADTARTLNQLMLNATFSRTFIDRVYLNRAAFNADHPWHAGNPEAFDQYRKNHAAFASSELGEGGRQVYRDVAARHRVPLIPFLLAGVAGEAHLNQPDGIHPNAEGARRVAEHVWRALHPMLVRT